MLGLIGAAIGGISSIIGGSSQASAQNQAVQKQYEYDKQTWRYRWEDVNREYDWLRKGTQIARNNRNEEIAYRNATALQDWRYQLAIADVQDEYNAKAYTKSLQTYGLQRSFNNMAAAAAYASEQRKLQDAVTEISFQNQDVTIQALQQAGTVQASGASGRSAGKALHSVLAQAGRNQAILAESLVSAKGNHKQAVNKITSDKYGADIQAWGNIMVKPIKSARPEAPFMLPKPVIQAPRKPKKPPKPIKGAKADMTGSIISGVGNTIGGVLSNWPS